MVECKTSDFVVVLFDGENEREERRGRAGLWEIGEMPNTAERGMAVRQGRRGRGWSRLGLARARWEMRLHRLVAEVVRGYALLVCIKTAPRGG